MTACISSLLVRATVWCALLPGLAWAQQPATESLEPAHSLLNSGRSLSDAAIARLQTAAVTQPPKADSVRDGIAKGALIGAGAAIGFIATMYAGCDAGCEAPAEGPMFLTASAIGAAIGAAIGWAVDSAHKNSATRVSLAVSAVPRRPSVRVALRF